MRFFGEDQMSRALKLFIAATMGILLTACASGPIIQSDYDRNVDFSQYKTYGYFSPLGIENPEYSSLLGQMFRDAINIQMQSRGYVLSENPDLLINVSARLEEKTQVRTFTDPMYVGYYGYRGGLYAPWGGYGYGTSTHVRQYTQGTVNIDLVDRSEKRMVWEGIAIGRVNEKRNNNLRQDIMDGVADMFAGYPFRAPG